MAGEMNGTKAVIKKDGTVVVGQMEGTLTIGGTPIDISNKSTNDYISLLDGELSGKQLTYAGTIIYNNHATAADVRADAIAGLQDSYTIEIVGSGIVTDESFAATMVPTGMSDSYPMGEKIATSLTWLSSGAFTHTPAADA